MSKHPIPSEALDDRLGFFGTAGSGKTYGSGTAVERVLNSGSRCVIVDPLGVWWGLRLRADGKTESKFNVVIFGGAHGDLPLTENSGALIGEAVATSKESCLLDLSQLGTKAAERRFMLAFLTAFYRHTTGEPVHLIFDEADMWSPQKLLDKEGDAAKLLGMMETIVRRGRVKGFIPWLISQRTAVISKDVLSQIDGLVIFKLTSSQDRAAIGDWIEGQADKQQGRDILAALPTKQRGDAVVWIPGRGVLVENKFPEKVTFDSSRTPKRGEKLAKTGRLKELDVGRLKEKLSTVEAETKANDPKALRAQLAAKDREIAELKRQKPATAPVIDRAVIAEAEARGVAIGKKQALTAIGRFASDISKSVGRAAQACSDAQGVLGALSQFAETQQEAIPAPAPRQVAAPPIQPALRAPLRVSVPIDPDRPLGAERKPLQALASVYPAGLTEPQWAVMAGLKRKGGTWSTYLSRLRSSGRVEKRGDLWFATEQGIADLGGDIPALPAPGRDLVEFWCGKIPGAAPMLRALAEIYPAFTVRDELASGLNLAANGGTFSTYLSRLRSPGLIEEDGKRLRVSPSVMERA